MPSGQRDDACWHPAIGHDLWMVTDGDAAVGGQSSSRRHLTSVGCCRTVCCYGNSVH